MATESQRRNALRSAIANSARRNNLSLSGLAIDAIIDRSIGHVQRRTLNESVRDTDISEAVGQVDRLTRNLKAFKSDGVFRSTDFVDFVAKSTNCFYPFCKSTK